MKRVSKSTVGLGNQPLEILGCAMMMVKLVDDRSKASVVLNIPFLYCPKTGGSFLSKGKLISSQVDFRRVEGRPYIYFGDKKEYRMSLIQHTQTPLFSNYSVVNPFDPEGNAVPVSSFVVCAHVHNDFAHINNKKLLESAEHGTIELTETGYRELKWANVRTVSKQRLLLVRRIWLKTKIFWRFFRYCTTSRSESGEHA
ncbi:unnamed protein product [Ambrosiozyma monospora]|uniref:Unnamed protein product n=1 Tax=Ambrosiozyma monospora TaxID=43982 RepID=A0A9W6Z1V1_AMBMO|nr:unnamed protein product [Ambrosiozyma monospora]